MSFSWPVPGHYNVSSGYDDWRSYGLHGAIDIGAPKVPTVAIGAGRIIFVGWARDAGLSVYLDMGTFRAHYCHLDSVNVSVGQVVQAGDVIGMVGASTRGVRDYPGYPNHLHLNLFTPQRPATGPSHWVGWVGMWCVDPELYLSKEDGDMPDEHSQHHQQLADRMKNLEHWLGAHMQAHQGTFDPNIRALNDRVGELEKRPASGGIKRGDTVSIKILT